MTTLRIDSDGPVTTIRFNRPEVRNAFNDEVITELRNAFESLPATTRVVVLTGEGKAFSAGADLSWMKNSRDYTQEQNAEDAARLAGLFEVVDRAPQMVIARVNGAALGGASGLVACADVVIAADSAKLGFTEVRLGLIPAVISPFVMRKIGEAAARRYFLTGEIFDAVTAQRIGLVHEVVPLAELDAAVQKVIDAVLGCGPKAVAAAKQLVAEVRQRDALSARDFTIERIAELRVSPEAQEGLAAFLEKRKPAWL